MKKIVVCTIIIPIKCVVIKIVCVIVSAVNSKINLHQLEIPFTEPRHTLFVPLWQASPGSSKTSADWETAK